MSNVAKTLSLLVAAGVVAFSGLAQAQVPVRQLGGPAVQPVVNQRHSYVSPWSGLLRWLAMDQVKQEIELVDEQSKKIDQIRKDVQTELRNLYQEMQDVPREERAKRTMQRNKELFDETEKRIKDVLLPQQLKRLEQVSLQMRLQSYGGFGYVLNSDDLAEKLKITDDQKEKLTTLQRELREELNTKIRELQAKMRKETKERTMELLDPQQRKQLEGMIGDKFDYQYPQYRGQSEKRK